MSGDRRDDKSDHRDQGGQGDQGGGQGDGDDRMVRLSRDDRADRGPGWNRGTGPYVDSQLFTQLDTDVYEAVATLEYSGRPVTVDEIVAATDLDAPAVGEILDALTEHGVLTRRQTGAGDAFELARRDWSATPDTRSH